MSGIGRRGRRESTFAPWANVRHRKGRLRRAVEQVQLDMAAPRMNPERGSHRIVVMNTKGGVGKTVTAAAIARHLSEVRAETVAIMDGNPHTGTLRRRLVPADVEPPWAIVHLASQIAVGAARSEWSFLTRWHDWVGRMRVFTNASADPGVVEAMTGAQYASVVDLISRQAQILVEDMGTSMMGEVALAGLDSADTLVLAADLTQDTLEMTIELITALAGQPMSFHTESNEYTSLADGRYVDLVRRAVVVVGPSREEDRDPADLTPLLDWLAAAVSGGGVVVVPKDQHLAMGDLIDWDLVDPETELAQMQVAALCAAQFPLVTSRRDGTHDANGGSV